LILYKDIFNILNKKIENTRRLAVLGVGSDLRADDGAGIHITGLLSKAFECENFPGLLLCHGGNAPENYTGIIKNFNPDHILVFDAANLGIIPGKIKEIDYLCINGPSFFSHMLPLRLMLDYLAYETGAQVTFFGIQYESLEFDQKMTPAVMRSAGLIAEALENIIKEKRNIFLFLEEI